jgi:CBS domain-containing protein
LEVGTIELKSRHLEILEIVKANQPVASEQIASHLNLTRSAIRADLNLLVMSGHLEAKPKIGYCVIEDSTRNRIVDYLKNIRVNDLKSRASVVDVKFSVYDTIVMMFLEDVSLICVTSEDHLVGVVSRKDLLKAAIGRSDINNVPVGMIMTRMPNIVMASPKDPIYVAAKKIIEHQIDALPVVEELLIDGMQYFKVVGRISKTSITKLFVEMGNQ